MNHAARKNNITIISATYILSGIGISSSFASILAFYSPRMKKPPGRVASQLEIIDF